MAIDTSLQDTEQAFRGWVAANLRPAMILLTGLQVVLSASAGTITGPSGHDFTVDGVRSGQTVTVKAGSATGTLVVDGVSGNVLTGSFDAGLAAIQNASDTTAWTLAVIYEVAWQGVTYDEKEWVPYFEAAWIPGEANTLELGQPKNRYREVGIFQLTVNAPFGDGMQLALSAASEMGGQLRNLGLSFGQSGSIRLQQPSVAKLGTGNGWTSAVVSVPYWRDAVPS